MTPDKALVAESYPDNDPTESREVVFDTCAASGYLRAEERAEVASGGERTLIKFWMVGIGGFIGSIARYALGSYIGNRFGSRFPYGTFVINISGSFLIGFTLTFLAQRSDLSPNWRYLIPIGFIGGYTTFSTFEYETLRAVQDGQILIAFANVGLSVVAGFVAVWLGAIAARAV